jgi:hypothetical protein
MSLFSKRKDLAVQSFVLKLLNTHSPGLTARLDGPRLDTRVNLALVVLIVPVETDRPQAGRAFSAVTKDFSNTGVAVVLKEPENLDQAILGFQLDGQMTFIRARAKHRDSMGGGFHQLGFQMLEVVSPSDCPELASLSL